MNNPNSISILIKQPFPTVNNGRVGGEAGLSKRTKKINGSVAASDTERIKLLWHHTDHEYFNLKKINILTQRE